ncbi:hypothetical protein CXB51_035269 [Gossypium anomalum]|uniref:RNase H type-1 domain-containing protein n=1 Tax=Gossypium anomalum TaxID=47600 RepID=A0A8J5Y117_9ROSI|nr:hypothetical protein CXB51_035269 [Gossypium anomalum]
MGFTSEWVALIMKCITTASYAVNINGSRGRIFRPTIGEGLLKGTKPSRKGSEISHLLFTDDCILFGEATDRGVMILKEALKEYERCSGQCVNFEKSTIFYSTNSIEVIKEEISELLGDGVVGYYHKGERKSSSNQSSRQYLPMLCLVSFYEIHYVENLKGIVGKGLYWKVGTGSNISSINDAWILNAINFRLSSVAFIMIDFKVVDLISSNEWKWKKESIVNTFLEEEARRILRIPLTREPHDDFMEWSGEPSGDFSEPKLWIIFFANALFQYQLIGCALWAIWGDKNTRIHDKVSRNGQEIAVFVKNYIKELNGVESRKSKNLKDVGKWKHPPGQGVKINFDRAYDARHFQSASGIVVRNRKGAILLSYSEIHQEVPSVFAAEAIACRKAIQIGIKMKWSEIIVKGDSLSVTSRSQYFRFQHTPRSANVLAHILEIETLKTNEEIYLVEGVPRYVEQQKVIGSEREPD